MLLSAPVPFDLSQVFATLSGLLTRQPFAVGGSGSSYVYGFVDAEFRGGMSKEECQQFVVNSTLVFSTQRFFFPQTVYLNVKETPDICFLLTACFIYVR